MLAASGPMLGAFLAQEHRRARPPRGRPMSTHLTMVTRWPPLPAQSRSSDLRLEY
jgi:hypothetical protein